MAQTSSYDVVVGTIATVMRVTLGPNEGPPGDYSFEGILERVTGEPIADETVYLLIDGVFYSSMVTAANGVWVLPFSVDPGATYTVQAVFDGTATYDASATSEYPVTPTKIGTVMNVTTAPPATADIGVPFPFDGNLYAPDPQIQIVGATVNLYANEMLVDTTTTVAGGVWAFDVTIGTPGAVAIYAEFPGDATYLGCAKKLSTGWLPPAGLLAVAGGLVGIACLRH